ncbi:MAG: pyridoxal phosphate enzyme (YggS family) [Chlamydiales bacterium]|jgi:pyridoxal phosphate enzyme (YggS family)
MVNISRNLSKLKYEIDMIAQRAGRDPEEITLVAVSKQHPVNSVLLAYNAGCLDFGENRVLEAVEKIRRAPDDARWHFVGNLQSGRVSKAVASFSLIHSVDSKGLAERISESSKKAGKITEILLQVNTSGEESKNGLTPEEWEECFKDIVALKGIRVKGLMTMAPLTKDKEIIRGTFARLREFRDKINPYSREEVFHLSMGMSNDYEIAIEEGATILRIGTEIFGGR